MRVSDRLSRSSFLYFLPGIAVATILATVYWFPALVSGLTAIHGDIPALSIPYVDFVARLVHGQTSVLWSDQLYGGHPFFAEGQIGALQPLNLIWGAAITPAVGAISSLNLFHWVLMIFGAFGVIGLCRSLGASAWGSAFGAISIVFSSVWTHEQYAVPVLLTLASIPWCLWAMEEWLKRQTLQSAILFGASCTSVFFCGYPQGLHGTVIYGVVSLFVVPFCRSSRREWMQNWPRRLSLGVAAIVVCLGLAAVQLLPMLELVELSLRSKGIGLAFENPLLAYIRGTLFTGDEAQPFFYKPGIGSVFVCTVASFAIICRPSPRVVGHLLAGLLLFQLGIQNASPLFHVLYKYHLLPGLNYFRIMHFYVAISAIGIGVAAAFGVDGVARWASRSCGYWSVFQPVPNLSKVSGFFILAAFCALWVWALIGLQAGKFSWIHIAVLAGVNATAIVMIIGGREKFVGPVYVLFLTVECLGLRTHPFNFFDKNVLTDNTAVAAIKSVPDWANYKFKTVSLSGLASLSPPFDPQLPYKMGKLVNTISPMTNLHWDIASLDAHTALPLMRRTEIEPILRDEIFGRAGTRGGFRLIDVLAIRFVTLDGDVKTAGFRQIGYNDRYKVWTMENTAALPRFQIYTKHRFVGSFAEAIKEASSMQERILIVERPERMSDSEIGDAGAVGDSSVPARFEVVAASPTRYVFRTSTAKPAWLFVADANYPGWTATVDGQSVSVFSAQILGKAVLLPVGDHVLTLQFRSQTFIWGAWISLFTLAAFIGALLFCRLKVPRRVCAT